jgi:hypothetical protein
MTADVPAAPPRFVDYLGTEVAAAVPTPFAMWPAEESLRLASEVVAESDPSSGDVLGALCHAFLDDVLACVKIDVLPTELEPCVFLDLSGRPQLIGTRRGNKIRIDADLNLALIRAVPLKLEGPRAAAIRGELRDLFCFPLGSADKRPVAALETCDLSEAAGEPGAFYLELDAPTGGGYVGGRFDRLRAYSDGKVLLVTFRPIGIDEDEEVVEQPLDRS